MSYKNIFAFIPSWLFSHPLRSRNNFRNEIDPFLSCFPPPFAMKRNQIWIFIHTSYPLTLWWYSDITFVANIIHHVCNGIDIVRHWFEEPAGRTHPDSLTKSILSWIQIQCHYCGSQLVMDIQWKYGQWALMFNLTQIIHLIPALLQLLVSWK